MIYKYKQHKYNCNISASPTASSTSTPSPPTLTIPAYNTTSTSPSDLWAYARVWARPSPLRTAAQRPPSCASAARWRSCWPATWLPGPLPMSPSPWRKTSTLPASGETERKERVMMRDKYSGLVNIRRGACLPVRADPPRKPLSLYRIGTMTVTAV